MLKKGPDWVDWPPRWKVGRTRGQKARPCFRHLTLQSLPRQEAPQAWMVLNWFSILIWVICPSWVLLKKHSNTYQDPVPGCLNLLAKQIIRECLLASPDTLDFGGFFPVLLEKQHGFSPPELAQAKKTAWFYTENVNLQGLSLFTTTKVCRTTEENYCQGCFFRFWGPKLIKF